MNAIIRLTASTFFSITTSAYFSVMWMLVCHIES